MADDFERRTIIAPWCGAGIEEDPAVPATAGAPLLCSYMVSDNFMGVFRRMSFSVCSYTGALVPVRNRKDVL